MNFLKLPWKSVAAMLLNAARICEFELERQPETYSRRNDRCRRSEGFEVYRTLPRTSSTHDALSSFAKYSA